MARSDPYRQEGIGGALTGLLALMEIQALRLTARTGPDGALIPLTEQNRARWDQLLIRRGLAALHRAEALGGEGPYGAHRGARKGKLHCN